MKCRRRMGVFILLVASSALFAQSLPESSYWDDIELRDGQLLRGVVVDRVKGQAIIQLSTRDFITLPETSVVRVKKGEARSAQKPVSVAVGASVDLSLTTAATPQQKAQWTTRWASRPSPSEASTIELLDGTLLQGQWVETEAGYAVIVLTDGSVTGVSRAKIRRVTAVGALSPAPTVEPAVLVDDEAAPTEPRPDLLEPLVSLSRHAWAIVNQAPIGSAATPYRTLFLPTAQTLPSGEFVLSQLDLVATQGTWGVTDSLQLQAATTLPGFAFPAFGSLSQAGVQYGIDLPAFEAGSWRVAILNTFLFHHLAQKDSTGHTALRETRGYLLPAAVLSLSLGAWDLSAMAGVWKGLQDDESRITAGTSVLGTIASHWAVVGDWGGAWELRSEPEHWFSAAWALRYWNSWLTVDVGVQLAAMLGKTVFVAPNSWWESSRNEYRTEWNALLVLPVLHLSFRP